MSARQGASVPPIKLLHSSQSSSYTAALTLRCTSSADRTSTSSLHLRSAGICCRWSDDVQHSARWSTRSWRKKSAHRPSDSRWRLIFSLPISTFSALGVSHVMRSINVRYLLTYFLTFYTVFKQNTHFCFRGLLLEKSNQFEWKFQTK